MKKIISIILALTCIISLTACGIKTEETKDIIPPETTTQTEATEQTNNTETAEESTQPTETTPIEEEKTFAELIYDESFSVEKLEPNFDNDDIEQFIINGEEYNIQEVTVEELHEDGYDTCGMAFSFVDNGYWYFTGIKYGLPNENGNRTDPINPIYIDTTIDGIISAISVDNQNTDAQFYNGLYVGMTEEEATKLLDGATRGETFGEYCYILKTDKTTLIVDMEDDAVKEILLIKNENMQLWYQNQN